MKKVRDSLHLTYRTARRIVIAVLGATVVLLGVAMLVLPGPGLLTIVLGLMLLGVEFAFARRWLARVKARTRQAADLVLQKLGRRGPGPDGRSGGGPTAGGETQDK